MVRFFAGRKKAYWNTLFILQVKRETERERESGETDREGEKQRERGETDREREMVSLWQGCISVCMNTNVRLFLNIILDLPN